MQCRLTQLRAITAIHIVQVVAILRQEFRIWGIEGEPIAAGLQLRNIVVAFPVFVARTVMWVEAEVIGTLEAILSNGCK